MNIWLQDLAGYGHATVFILDTVKSAFTGLALLPWTGITCGSIGGELKIVGKQSAKGWVDLTMSRG